MCVVAKISEFLILFEPSVTVPKVSISVWVLRWSLCTTLLTSHLLLPEDRWASPEVSAWNVAFPFTMLNVR